MAKERQELLMEAWTGGKKGCLSALSEAKAWALREVWRGEGKGDYGMLEFVAARVQKVKGGKPSGSAISQFFDRVDDDKKWFPGKREQGTYGPKPVVCGAKRRAFASCAQRVKSSGHEPTYARMIADAPQATQNPNTGRPVDKKRVYDVFRSECRDPGSEETWEHRARYSKTAITAPMMLKRFAFAKHVSSLGLTVLWFFRHVIWTDICNSILPRTEAKASAQALSRKGARGWGSPDCQLHSANLRGKKEDLKQNSWGTIKIWWMPVLMRGKLHVEVFDDSYPGETEDGAEVLVAKVRAAVNRRFQGDAAKPDTVMVDRGKGFYNIGTGNITTKFRQALADHGLKNLMGNCAAVQPGHMQEILLHETAVAWIRHRLTTTTPSQCWLETPTQYEKRLKGVVEDINANLDVEGLCNNLLKRVDGVIESKGGRVKW